MSNLIHEEWQESRLQWLEERDRTWGDVMRDKYGEYIMVENDYTETRQFTKVYLPEVLQDTYEYFEHEYVN